MSSSSIPSYWGILKRVLLDKESPDLQLQSIPNTLCLYDEKNYIGRFPNPDHTKGFTHISQYALPVPFLSHTHFSVDINRNDNTITVTDYSRNGTFIKRHSDNDNENKNNENIKNEECELIGPNKSVVLCDGDAIVLRFKQENKLMFLFKIEKSLSQPVIHGSPGNGGTPCSMVLSGDDSLQSQVTQLLAEASRQERILAESKAKNEMLSKDLSLTQREIETLKSTIQEKESSINELQLFLQEHNLIQTAQSARIQKCDAEIKELKQEIADLKSKINMLTDDLNRKTELVEQREELVNKANKSYELEKKTVIELSEKLEEAQVKLTNAVNANLALQDCIQDRTIADENMLKVNTSLLDILNNVNIARNNDNSSKRMKTNEKSLAAEKIVDAVNQFLAAVHEENQTELDNVLDAVDFPSFEGSIRDHRILVETPTTEASGNPQRGSLHTLSAPSVDNTLDDISIKVVNANTMDIEGQMDNTDTIDIEGQVLNTIATDLESQIVKVTTITEYLSSSSNSDTDSEDEKYKWTDRMMMMTTQMPQDDLPESDSRESVGHEVTNQNTNESQFADEGSLKGSLLDVGFSDDNNNKLENLENEINLVPASAPAPAPASTPVPTVTNSQTKHIITSVMSEMVVIVEDIKKGNTNQEDECNEFYCTPTKKRNAENQEVITTSSEKRTKFCEVVTIINNNENANELNTNMNMTIHYESPCDLYE